MFRIRGWAMLAALKCRSVLLTILFAPVAAMAQGATDSDMILSKSDAIRLFGLTQQQWLAQRAQIISSGAALPHGNQPEAAGFRTEPQPGVILLVVVRYGAGPARPDMVSVGSLFRGRPFATLNVDPQGNRARFEGAIARAQQELAPEFFVYGEVFWAPDGAGVLFTISKVS